MTKPGTSQLIPKASHVIKLQLSQGVPSPKAMSQSWTVACWEPSCTAGLRWSSRASSVFTAAPIRAHIPAWALPPDSHRAQTLLHLTHSQTITYLQPWKNHLLWNWLLVPGKAGDCWATAHFAVTHSLSNVTQDGKWWISQVDPATGHPQLPVPHLSPSIIPQVYHPFCQPLSIPPLKALLNFYLGQNWDLLLIEKFLNWWSVHLPLSVCISLTLTLRCEAFF